MPTLRFGLRIDHGILRDYSQVLEKGSFIQGLPGDGQLGFSFVRRLIGVLHLHERHKAKPIKMEIIAFGPMKKYDTYVSRYPSA